MHRLLIALTVVALVAGACADEGAPDSGPTAAPTTPASPTDAPTDEPTDEPTGEPTTAPTGEPTAEPTASPTPAPTATPPFPANEQPDTGEPTGDPVTLAEVTYGRHEGFERVVLTFGGGGNAGWDVRYVDEPRHQGSGDPVEVAGEAVLELTLDNSGYPDDTGVDFYDGPKRIDGGGVVTEIVVGTLYEGITQVFVGVDQRHPFRVFALDGPARVVLDVRA